MSTNFSYYSSGSLAGLDSVIFHYDNSNTRMNCNVSCILLSALEAQQGPPLLSQKYERQPLGARDTNAPSRRIEKPTATKPRPSSVKRPRALDLSRPNAKATSKRPVSPLPVIPATPLCVPALPRTAPHSLPPLQSVPSVYLPSYSSDPETSPIHSPVTPDREQAHEAIVLTHHNSPYVPWPTPVRREYLCTTSPASTQYSRSYSRSGAVAPEPGSYRERDRLSVKRAFKKLGRRIQHGFKSVSKQICPTRKSARPHQSPPPRAEPITLRRCSVLSTDSVMTTSLETWLSERIQSLEKPSRSVKFQTLEEYEQHGSWIHVPAAQSRASMASSVSADSLLSGLSLRTNSYIFPPTPSVAALSPWMTSPGVSRFTQGQRQDHAQVCSPLRAAF